MKVLLIIPPSEIFKKRNRNTIKKKVGLLPQLGVLILGSVLEKKGDQVKIIDGQLLDSTFKEIIEEINTFNPDIIGISFITAQKFVADELIHKIKETSDHIIIVGGAHPTCFPEETIEKNKDIDILVFGEAEHTFPKIIKDLESKKSIKTVPGILFREKDKIIRNNQSNKVVDLDKLPFPARHLLPINLYVPSPFENKKQPSTSILVSRGCTYSKCTFCYRSSKMKRLYRCQSVKKTIAEISHLKNKYNIEELVFYDDDLLANKRWVKRFCDEMLDSTMDIIWSFRGRPCNANYDILKKAKQAGCWSIEIGFESGNQDLLDKIKKGITLEESKNIVRWCNELAIETVGTFIIALPGEDFKKGMNTINFAVQADCSYAAFIPTHPAKGTPFYDQCLNEGEMVKEEYTKESKLSWFIPQVSYVPDGYKNKEHVEKLLKKAYLKFYLRPKYIFKHFMNIRTKYDINRYLNGIRFIIGVLKS